MSGLTVYQCVGCREVLGDSLSLRAHEPDVGRIVLKKVVGLSEAQDRPVTSGENSAIIVYNELSCNRCGKKVGKVYIKGPPEMGKVIGYYALDREAITTYRLGEGAAVDRDASNRDQNNVITALQMVVVALDRRISKLEGKPKTRRKRMRSDD